MTQRRLKVLVACEESGTVRDAFLRLGHDAISCDLKPTSVPGPHYTGSVFDIIDQGYDLMIGFPPCTYLAKVQMFRYATEPGRVTKRDQAVEFFQALYNCSIPHVCLENPTGWLSTAFKYPTQIIRPWHHGDPYDKEINLWMKNLPPIMATVYSPLRRSVVNHTNGRMNQAQKSHIKSSWKYFPGTAMAIAKQLSDAVSLLVYPMSALLTVIHIV